MLNTAKAPQNVVAIQLSGIVTVDDIQVMKTEFQNKLSVNQNVGIVQKLGIVIDMTQLDDITADAIAEDIKFETELLGELERFPRAAIVSDKQWVEAVVKFVNPLIPSMDFKIFAPDALDEAIEFAAETNSVGPKSKSPAITMIETGDENLVAYEMNGRLEKEDVDRAMKVLNEAFAREGKIDLFVRLKDLAGFDPAILMHRSLLSLKFAALDKVRRYAVVGAKGWMEKTIHLFDRFISVEIKTFDADEEQAAWEWLKS